MTTIGQIIKRICVLIFDAISKAGLYLTQTAREERAQRKFREIYHYYRRYAKTELTGIYITTKAAYEYKKCFFAVWSISLAAVFFSGAWKCFVQFLMMIMQIAYDGSMNIDILQTNALFSSIMFVMVCGVVLLFLYWYICGMREMYLDLLIMQKCLKIPEKAEIRVAE